MIYRAILLLYIDLKQIIVSETDDIIMMHHFPNCWGANHPSPTHSCASVCPAYCVHSILKGFDWPPRLTTRQCSNWSSQWAWVIAWTWSTSLAAYWCLCASFNCAAFLFSISPAECQRAISVSLTSCFLCLAFFALFPKHMPTPMKSVLLSLNSLALAWIYYAARSDVVKIYIVFTYSKENWPPLPVFNGWF